MNTDDYTAKISSLPLPDSTAIEAATIRQAQLTKPAGSLGRLEDIAVWVAGWQGTEKPHLENPVCLVFAGNHGVVAQGVSAFPSEVTAQMVKNFTHGGAAINQLCRAAGITLSVTPIDLEKPTADFTLGPAMTIKETLTAMDIGAAAIPDDADIVLVGEMGIGNTTAAAAIAYATFGGRIGDWVGRGTGVDDAGLTRKAEAISRGMAANQKAATTGLEILAAFGGREMAAIAGAVLEARHRRIPVLLDGFISTASALPIFKDNATGLHHCQISHRSTEPGHSLIIDHLGLSPLLELDLRLGEGSGAATAFPLVRAAIASHSGMATFTEAGVSEGK
jgi:nicotinate-nucleotide--dimethylbenzimidazole phosphoribosyltransferase